MAYMNACDSQNINENEGKVLKIADFRTFLLF